MTVVRDALSRTLRHPLTWVLLVAAVVRIVLIAGVSVSLGYADSSTYAAMANDADASNGVAPSGYPLFMRALGLISHSVDLLLVVQHVLMLLAAVCVYRIARRLTCGRGTATVAAGVMALSGNVLAAGQAVLTDGLFTFLVTLAALQALRFFDGRRWRDAVLLGVVLGAAAAVKSVALPLLALAVLVMLLARPTVRNTGKAAATGLAAVGVVALVAVLMSSTSGVPLVGKSAQGWLLYGKAATFADCSKIPADDRLRYLCPTEPAFQRNGPDYWRVIGGPAFERFGGMPNGDDELRRFATGVYLRQPLDFIKAVVVDTGRFVAPNFGHERGYNGAGWDEFELDRVIGEPARSANEAALETWFDPLSTRASTLNLIARYQELTTVQNGHLGVLLLLGIAAVTLASGPLRWRAGLMLLWALAVLVGSTALNMYVARYALPAFGVLLALAALGVELVAVRLARTRTPDRELAVDPAPDGGAIRDVETPAAG